MLTANLHNNGEKVEQFDSSKRSLNYDSIGNFGNKCCVRLFSQRKASILKLDFHWNPPAGEKFDWRTFHEAAKVHTKEWQEGMTLSSRYFIRLKKSRENKYGRKVFASPARPLISRAFPVGEKWAYFLEEFFCIFACNKNRGFISFMVKDLLLLTSFWGIQQYFGNFSDDLGLSFLLTKIRNGRSFCFIDLPHPVPSLRALNRQAQNSHS